MGYTTDFYGSVTVEPPLNEHERDYLREFSGSRRMDRANGPYFVKGDGAFGQGGGPDVIHSHNAPPAGQPGLWCQWAASEDGTEIEWDGGEKFYDSVEWMQYLIDHFFRAGALAQGDTTDERFAHFTFDHVVNGTIRAEGEDSDDRWALVVTDNEVEQQEYSSFTETDLEEIKAEAYRAGFEAAKAQG